MGHVKLLMNDNWEYGLGNVYPWCHLVPKNVNARCFGFDIIRQRRIAMLCGCFESAEYHGGQLPLRVLKLNRTMIDRCVLPRIVVQTLALLLSAAP